MQIARLRNNRKAPWVREILAQNSLRASDLILPIFVVEGQNQKQKIENLPDVYRFSIDLAVKEAKKAYEAGIRAIMLFPVIEQNLKDENGSEALNSNNLICRAIKEIKASSVEIGIICDVALDPYTIHGHDGILNEKGDVDNDKTVEILCKQALIQVKAGADGVAPSDMMDGRINAIRQSFENEGCKDAIIISYAAKYASNFYGPFRSAVGSAQNIKNADKKTYQMDFCNEKEAMREILQDEKEGADMLIVKPGILYIDIVSKACKISNLPIISYQVSGEFAMLKIGAQNGIINYESAMMESLIAFKRAGASAIITYAALEIALLLA
jgi:porphobilinogen synthase